MRSRFRTERLPVIATICGVIFVIALMVIPPFAVLREESNREINTHEYKKIEEWMSEYPELKPKMQTALEDLKISAKEYKAIEDETKNLARQSWARHLQTELEN